MDDRKLVEKILADLEDRSGFEVISQLKHDDPALYEDLFEDLREIVLGEIEIEP